MKHKKTLTEQLHCRVDVYGRQETKNRLGEKDYTYEKIKSVWADIKPQRGNQSNGEGNTQYVETSHKFILRAGAVKEIANDMYFIYQGQRYDIKYYFPNFLQKDRIEVFCELRIE